MSACVVAADKIFDPSSGQSIAQWLERFDRPLVFTNGCFDILHLGHVTYLEEAATLGRSLVVGVNSDRSVRKQNKIPRRPINPLQDRMAILAALASVDGVISFDAPTPLELIMQVRPDHLVKGGDWAPADIVGSEQVTALGGQVHAIEFEFQRSTTDLIRRIREG